MLEHEKCLAEVLAEDYALDLQVRERKLEETRNREREAHKLVKQLRAELTKMQAHTVLETEAMQKRLADLKFKEVESKLAEDKLMDDLTKKEKELEVLRMNQMHEKQTMMNKLRQQEREAEEKFAAVVKEQKILTKENAERAEEQAVLAKAQKIRLESLERKVSWLTRRCLFFFLNFQFATLTRIFFFFIHYR